MKTDPPTDPPEFTWNQTPWDDMDREQLIRELIKRQSAIHWALYPLACAAREGGVFWSHEGCGGKALETIEACKTQEFPALRYVDSITFPDSHGSQWTVCDKCGEMLGGGDTNGYPCTGLSKRGCTGTHHPITWETIRSLP